MHLSSPPPPKKKKNKKTKTKTKKNKKHKKTFPTAQTPCTTDGWFGRNCQYQCHCARSAACDKVDGSCSSGCHQDWFGHACQYGEGFYYRYYLVRVQEFHLASLMRIKMRLIVTVFYLYLINVVAA